MVGCPCKFKTLQTSDRLAIEVVQRKSPYMTPDITLNFSPFYKEIQGNLEGESISLSGIT